MISGIKKINIYGDGILKIDNRTSDNNIRQLLENIYQKVISVVPMTAQRKEDLDNLLIILKDGHCSKRFYGQCFYSEKKITLYYNDSAQIQRTFAHELCHYLFQDARRRTGLNFSIYSNSHKVREYLANTFAKYIIENAQDKLKAFCALYQ